MSTAQLILVEHNTDTYNSRQSLESEVRDRAIKVVAHNCFDRTWTFLDGSQLNLTHVGYSCS